MASFMVHVRVWVVCVTAAAAALNPEPRLMYGGLTAASLVCKMIPEPNWDDKIEMFGSNLLCSD